MSEQIETIILNQEKEIHVEQSEQQRIDERTELNILRVMLHDKTEQCSKLDLEKTELLKKQYEINITLIDMEYDMTKTKAQLKTTADSLTNANLLIEQLKPNPFKTEKPPHKYVSLQSLRNSSYFASYFGPGISAAECMNY